MQQCEDKAVPSTKMKSHIATAEAIFGLGNRLIYIANNTKNQVYAKEDDTFCLYTTETQPNTKH